MNFHAVIYICTFGHKLSLRHTDEVVNFFSNETHYKLDIHPFWEIFTLVLQIEHSFWNYYKKNFLAKFFIKVYRFRLIHQKLNSKDFLRPLVVTHLFKIEFPTINFLAKFFIKSHRFWLIHQKLNSKGFFQPLVVTHLFKIQFSTKNFLPKFFIRVHRFRLIHQKLNSNGFFRTLVVTHLFRIQFPTKCFLAKF